MKGMRVHKKLLEKFFIHEEKMNDLYNYICANLNCQGLNYSYWEEQYALANQLYFAMEGRKKMVYCQLLN